MRHLYQIHHAGARGGGVGYSYADAGGIQDTDGRVIARGQTTSRVPRAGRQRPQAGLLCQVPRQGPGGARSSVGEMRVNQGLRAIEDVDVLRVKPIDDLGTPVELVKLLGGKQGYLAALAELEQALYAEAE